MKKHLAFLTASLFLIFSSCENRLTSDLEVFMTVEEPVFTPAEGTYDDDMTVEISCPTDGAAIYYTTDGSEPNQGSQLYEGPFTLEGDGARLLLFARAFHNDMDSSGEVNAQFLIEYPGPNPPVLDLSPGIYSSDITGTGLTISHDASNFDVAKRWIEQGLDVTIHYTTDGSQPDQTSPVYTLGQSFPVTGDGTKFILNAVSYADGYKLSDAVTGIYTISYSSQVETPSISGTAPEAVLDAEATFYLECATAGATIYYTTDGSAPTESSSLYSSASGITIFSAASDGDSCTVRARAYLDGMKASEVFETSYVYKEGTVSPPEISFSADYTQIYITFTCSTPDATIYYTTNRSVPDPDSPTTSSFINGGTLGGDTSDKYVNAVAEKNGRFSSIVSESVTFTDLYP